MAEIELPQVVRIGPHDYRVNPPGSRLPRDVWGEASVSRHEILVDESLEPMQLAETWLHELLHMLCRDANLEDVDFDLEERIVNGLARSTLAFMRDNPAGLDPVWEAIGTCRRQDLADKLNAGGCFR